MCWQYTNKSCNYFKSSDGPPLSCDDEPAIFFIQLETWQLKSTSLASISICFEHHCCLLCIQMRTEWPYVKFMEFKLSVTVSNSISSTEANLHVQDQA